MNELGVITHAGQADRRSGGCKYRRVTSGSPNLELGVNNISSLRFEGYSISNRAGTDILVFLN
jgi:hypothetical protein